MATGPEVAASGDPAMLARPSDSTRAHFTFLQLSLAPGFSPVVWTGARQAVLTACLPPKARKPLKRFSFRSLEPTRLKPGANERFPTVFERVRCAHSTSTLCFNVDSIEVEFKLAGCS